MKRLFYVRHGETEMNVKEIFSGQVETPLTENGRAQAREAGTHIKKNLPKIDLIIASPLSRAHHTAEIIAKEIGYSTDKIITNPLLMERSFGVLEGTHGPTFVDIHGRQALDNVKDAESIEMVQKRALEAYKFVQSHPQNNILVVAHGTFGRAFWRVVNNLPHTHEYEGERWRLKNAEVVELI